METVEEFLARGGSVQQIPDGQRSLDWSSGDWRKEMNALRDLSRPKLSKTEIRRRRDQPER